MSFTPDSLQRLLLWRLAVSEEGGEFLKNIEVSSLSPARRSPLVREGLIEEQRHKISETGRALSYLELTDKGWAWCQNHLAESFQIRRQTPRLAAIVLERLLALMKDYFDSESGVGSFGEFVLQARSGRSTVAPTGSVPASSDAERNGDVAREIRHACLELGQGRTNTRVRLADLRRSLTSVSRKALDDALLTMERAGELSLYSLDDPREITATDRDAALRTAAGSERHIVYFGGSGS